MFLDYEDYFYVKICYTKSHTRVFQITSGSKERNCPSARFPIGFPIAFRGSKFQSTCEVVSLANTDVDGAPPPDRILILTLFSHVTIFLYIWNVAILQIFNFFTKINYMQIVKLKYGSRFFSYFDVKSLSFAKINPCKISKLQYLWKLKQAKILQ